MAHEAQQSKRPKACERADDRDPLWPRVLLLAAFFAVFLNIFADPYPFAMTQMLFDYSEGWSRRGLVGEFLTFFTGDSVSLREAMVSSVVITSLGAIALVVYLWPRLRGDLFGTLILLVFLCSFAFASFLGSPGYLDGVILALVVLALCALERGPWGFAVAAVALTLSVMTHENALPYYSAMLGLAAVIIYGQTARAWFAGIVLVGVGLTVTVLLFTIGQLDSEAALRLAQSIQDKAEFPTDPEALDVAGRGLTENLTYIENIRSRSAYPIWLAYDGGLFAIMAGVMIWLNLAVMAGSPLMLRLWMVAAILAPKTLNLIAFDVTRFGTASVFAGFMILAVNLRYLPEARTKFGNTLTVPLVVLLLLFNLQASNMQMNPGDRHFYKFPYGFKQNIEWWQSLR